MILPPKYLQPAEAGNMTRYILSFIALVVISTTGCTQTVMLGAYKKTSKGDSIVVKDTRYTYEFDMEGNLLVERWKFEDHKTGETKEAFEIKHKDGWQRTTGVLNSNKDTVFFRQIIYSTIDSLKLKIENGDTVLTERLLIEDRLITCEYPNRKETIKKCYSYNENNLIDTVRNRTIYGEGIWVNEYDSLGREKTIHEFMAINGEDFYTLLYTIRIEYDDLGRTKKWSYDAMDPMENHDYEVITYYDANWIPYLEKHIYPNLEECFEIVYEIID